MNEKQAEQVLERLKEIAFLLTNLQDTLESIDAHAHAIEDDVHAIREKRP